MYIAVASQIYKIHVSKVIINTIQVLERALEYETTHKSYFLPPLFAAKIGTVVEDVAVIVLHFAAGRSTSGAPDIALQRFSRNSPSSSS